ncbi:MAG: hypothetical protein GX299_06350, partial [Epulopiscium sp.]|nr:hypothetical protein [Candidatus Epulonipiscium sp.]
EKNIEQTEEKIKQLEELLFQEAISSDAEKAANIFSEKVTLESYLEELYSQWEELQ